MPRTLNFTYVLCRLSPFYNHFQLSIKGYPDEGLESIFLRYVIFKRRLASNLNEKRKIFKFRFQIIQHKSAVPRDEEIHASMNTNVVASLYHKGRKEWSANNQWGSIPMHAKSKKMKGLLEAYLTDSILRKMFTCSVIQP